MERRRTNITLAMFPDATGYECLLNKFHIEDYLDTVESNLPSNHSSRMASASSSCSSSNCRGRSNSTLVLSCDDERCVMRFHKTRPGEKWLAETWRPTQRRPSSK
jgi:hypothetical protein